jgi:hypothetical protein
MTDEPTTYESLDEALHAFQANLPTLVKDKDGQVGNQKTKYADLNQANDVILSRLNALGVIWVCSPDILGVDPGRFILRWELKHLTSGTSRAGMFPILGDSPMKYGSAITYARRYALLAVTGVAAEEEDDDAMSHEAGHQVARRAASGNARQQRAARPARAPGETVRHARPGPPLPGENTTPLPEDTPPPDGDEAAIQASLDAPRMVQQWQHKKMHALWKEAGYGDDSHAGRAQRIEVTGRLVGRPIGSSKELTEAEGDTVIRRLEAKIAKDRAATAGDRS